MKLTIGIKALNEERHIQAAIESALQAGKKVEANVVLADSGSTDRTLEIAARYPIKVVQLANASERSCGTGAQLAFQYCDGNYFYMMDGDMVLSPEFVEAGIAYLESHPQYAAVGGRVVEMNTEAHEFQIRANAVANDKNWLPGTVDRLDCGGLYRVSAIRQVGYFADRNLHAFEEFELGARLSTKGWLLARIDMIALKHFGHATSGYKLLWRRLMSGYSGAPGEVLRASWGGPSFYFVLKRLGHIRNAAVVLVWWAALLMSFVGFQTWTSRVIAIALLCLVPVGLLAFRRRSLTLGIFSFISWNASAMALFAGFFRRRVPPADPIAAVGLPVDLAVST